MPTLINEGDSIIGNKIVCEARKIEDSKTINKLEGIKPKELY